MRLWALLVCAAGVDGFVPSRRTPPVLLSRRAEAREQNENLALEVSNAKLLSEVLELEAPTLPAIVSAANYELQIDGEGPLRTQLDAIEAELGTRAD